MCGGLFKCLQQRIKRVFGQHVHFVDDVNLIPRRNRSIAHCFNDFADIVDTGMAGGIHFDDIDMAPFGNGCARLALPTGIDCRSALPVGTDAIQRFCNQARGRGFPDPTYSGHQKGMCQPVAFDRIAQRLDHRILTDELRKILRTIFAREHAVWRCFF